MSNIVGKCLSFLQGFTSSNWLHSYQFRNSLFLKGVSATTAWFIWKARCNHIFKNESPDFDTIAYKVVPHAEEFSSTSSLQAGKCLLLSNFSSSKGLFLFSTAAWIEELVDEGAGFCLKLEHSHPPGELQSYPCELKT